MSIQPDDILATAIALSERVGPDGAVAECDQRSAASRAYYAALHAVDVALPTDIRPSDQQKRGPNSHQIIIDAAVWWSNAVRPGRSEARIMARTLPKLKVLRKRADYNIDADFTVSEMETALEYARLTMLSARRAKTQVVASGNA